MGNLWSKEPTMILAVVSAGLAMGMGFGLPVTPQQMGLIMAFAAAVLGLINRAQVTSPQTLQDMTPATLAKAQDAAQPVKDTIRKLPVVLLVCVLGFGSTAASCPKKVTGDTPIATAALTADAIVIRVNELQATVIQACGPAPQCQPNSLSTPLARDLVQTCIDLRTVLRATPYGGPAAARAAWAQARPRFKTVTNPAIVAALVALDTYLGGIQ